MEEILRQVATLLRRMWKFRWPGLLTAWVVAIVGAIGVSQIPDQYEASARIFVDTQSILKPLMAGLTVQPNVEQQVGMLSRTLISRPNLEKLTRMADLDLKNDSKNDREALLEGLGKALQIRSTGRDNLYTLSFRDAESDKAKRVIQSLVSIFVESSLGASRKDTDSAKVFLNEQIKNYEAKLEEAEARLKEFRVRNIEIQTTEGQDAASQLGEIAKQLQQAKLELSEAENSREAAKQQILAERKAAGQAGAAASATMVEPEVPIATPEIDSRIDAQKRNLDTLLQRYTEQHPDVIITRKLIKDLEEQRRAEVDERKKVAARQPGGSGSPADAVTQELNRLLAGTELQVGALRARVAEFQARFARAKDRMKTAPQIEAEATQLNRDYGITKKNYEDLVTRRQSAVMSGELDVASGIADFRLIDPPRVTPKPVSPNRLALYPLALVAAIAAGIFIAFVASQLRPAYDAAFELRAKTGLPVLGVVSLIVSEADARRGRRDLFRFIAGSGGLVGMYAVGVAVFVVLAARQAG